MTYALVTIVVLLLVCGGLSWRLWYITRVASNAKTRIEILEGKLREAQAAYAASVHEAEDEHGVTLAAAGEAATVLAEASDAEVVDAFNDAFDGSEP